MKPYKTGQNNQKYNAKSAKFQHKTENLFYICACKCKKEELCSYPKKLKAIKDEKVFEVNQPSVRKMFTGRIDRKKCLNCKKEAIRFH